MCTVLLPPGGYPIAVNKYIVSYHIKNKLTSTQLASVISSILATRFDLTGSSSGQLVQDTTQDTVQFLPAKCLKTQRKMQHARGGGGGNKKCLQTSCTKPWRKKTLRELEWVFEKESAWIYLVGDKDQRWAVVMNLHVPKKPGDFSTRWWSSPPVGYCRRSAAFRHVNGKPYYCTMTSHSESILAIIRNCAELNGNPQNYGRRSDGELLRNAIVKIWN